jgi:glucose/arabinose dehydrogenase
MTMATPTRPIIAALVCIACGSDPTDSGETPEQPPPQTQWVVPAGFQVDVFAENVANARSMALGPQGTVFVGSRTAGRVHAVVDRDGDHKAERVVVIASGLNQPNGIAMRNGALYIATASQLLRFDDIEQHLDAPLPPVIVRAALPNPTAGHTWKFIAFGPDDRLYMSVGAPCNVARTDGRRVTRYETFLDGGFLPNRANAPGGSAAQQAAAGRPADVLQMPDGSLLVSDDTGDRLLRVSYQ